MSGAPVNPNSIGNAEPPRIQWAGCAAENFRAGREGMRPEAIVIHVADGTLAGTDAWFGNPAAQLSAHYIVAKDGAVHQYVKEEDMAFHAGAPVRPVWALLKPGVNPNLYTIGIEHEGFAADVWPEAQYEASAALVREIAERWSIPVDEEHIVLHREIRADKTCPGLTFDRERLIRMVEAAKRT